MLVLAIGLAVFTACVMTSPEFKENEQGKSNE